MGIDQPGQDDHAPGVDDLVGGRWRSPSVHLADDVADDVDAAVREASVAVVHRRQQLGVTDEKGLRLRDRSGSLGGHGGAPGTNGRSADERPARESARVRSASPACTAMRTGKVSTSPILGKEGTLPATAAATTSGGEEGRQDGIPSGLEVDAPMAMDSRIEQSR